MVYNVILKHAAPFLADCYDNPSTRPNSSRASDDLHTGLHIFSERIKDTMGLTVITTPPGTHLRKKHQLHDELRKALNKHRNLHTPMNALYKILRGIDDFESLKKINSHKYRPLFPKVPHFMTVTSAENADDIIAFLNTGTSTAFTYLTDLHTAFSYLTTPSLNSLAIQHHLKEELLFYLGIYNYVASSHTSIATVKQYLPPSTDNTLTERMKHNMRWSAFGYKSFAKMAIKTAENLGAVCLLLRFEATAKQHAPQLGDLLIYNEDAVAPSILVLRGRDYFDAAIKNGTLRPIKQHYQSNKSFPSQKRTKRLNGETHSSQLSQRSV